MALYDPERFEPLLGEPWAPSRVEDAIAAIVADADAAFDPEELWPAHESDASEGPVPLKSLYAGAAGVIWALDELRRSGHAESSLELARAALRTLELERAAPDFAWDEHYHPASSQRVSPVHSCIAMAASSVPGAPQLMSSVGLATLSRASAYSSSASAGSEVSRKATSNGPVSPLKRDAGW